MRSAFLLTHNPAPKRPPVYTYKHTYQLLFGIHYIQQETREVQKYLLSILDVPYKQFGSSVPTSGYVVGIDTTFRGRCNGSGKAKITQFDHTLLRDEDVLRFDVTMDDLMRVSYSKHRVTHISMTYLLEK